MWSEVRRIACGVEHRLREVRWRLQSVAHRLYLKWARIRITHRLSPSTDRLIMFLSPSQGWKSGGILSIASLYEESSKLSSIHHAAVVICTIPGDPALLKYRWFPNNNYLLDADAVIHRCVALKFLMIHVPEFTVDRVADWLQSKRGLPLADKVHINILLQNIDMIADQNVDRLASFGTVTCSTAHEAYSTPQTRDRFEVPLHRMSVYLSPERYRRVGYEAKENILVVSPDAHPLREKVLRTIQALHPHLRTQVVEDLTYPDYKDLISRAKWALTFGEGLDGYFVEPIFSGGIAFAVFNERFFTPEFANVKVVYRSWEELMRCLPDDIDKLDNPIAYTAAWRQPYELLCQMYNSETYRENLRRFYRGDYSYP